jgi:TM2 domain.
MLRNHSGAQAQPNIEGKSPIIALMLGLIPGLGAAYNGQPVKALVQFIVIAGLWTLADVFHSTLEVTCALASFAFYVFHSMTLFVRRNANVTVLTCTKKTNNCVNFCALALICGRIADRHWSIDHVAHHVPGSNSSVLAVVAGGRGHLSAE